MVFAYALLGVTDHRQVALDALEQPDTIVVPDSLYAELANVVWQWIRNRDVDRDTGLTVLSDAQALIDRSLPASLLWVEALALAIEADHPVYDTLFVAAARHEDSRVVTFDRRMQAAFPELTLRPGDLAS